MNETERVTLVIPKEIWEQVKRLAPSGQRSHLVAEALEAEIRRRKRQTQVIQLLQFRETMLKKYGESATSAEDIATMRQARDNEIENGSRR